MAEGCGCPVCTDPERERWFQQQVAKGWRPKVPLWWPTVDGWPVPSGTFEVVPRG